jgi:site-specific DNA recombinase
MISGRTAIYARVSSEAQARENTIASQIASLRERVAADGLWLEPADCFVDEGYSGSILVRPGLEQLRDAAASGRIERLYVHAPDRLARRYAHQVLLIDELRRAGVEIVFLNRPIGDTPEDDLLLQVQGVIAEYERAKILERGRRGRRHAARSGSVSALTGAPFGYRYVSRSEGGGVARFEVVEEEARIVRLIFAWVGRERLSLREACRRLQEMNCRTRQGSPQWHASTLRGMLINPAYTGHAAFGRFHYLPPRPRLRAQRGHSKPSSHPVSRVPASREEWIDIPVTSIVDDATFEAVRAQLAENKQRKRDRETGHVWLLQGLTVCRRCGYAYYGKSAPRTREYDRTNVLRYYRCTGADGHKFQGQALCCNPPVRADQLEEVVWDRVKAILQEPERIADEYNRRIAQAAAGAEESEEVARLEKQMAGVRRGIERLIDSYAGGFVEKDEFEPRITGMKQRMSQLKERCEAAVQATEHERDIRLVVSRLEDFATKVSDGLYRLDRAGQREIIRAMVKRIDIEQGELEIVFRVPPPHVPSDPDPSARGKGTPSWQHCTPVRRTLHRMVEPMPPFGQGLGKSQPQRPHFPPPRLNPHHATKAL